MSVPDFLALPDGLRAVVLSWPFGTDRTERKAPELDNNMLVKLRSNFRRRKKNQTEALLLGGLECPSRDTSTPSLDRNSS
jgi:hypothetical protein